MKYSQRTVTNAGADLLANALQEEKSVVIDSIVISDVILPADKDLKTVQLSDITSYLNFPVIYIKKPDVKTIQPGCRISNYDVPVNNETSKYLTNIHQITNDDGTTGSAGDLASNFSVNTVACLGHIDGDTTDTLIDVAIADTGEAFQMDAATEIVFRLFFDFAVKIENDLSNDNITINVNNAGAITYEDLENEIQKLHNDYVSLNGDNTIQGTKNFVGDLQYNGSEVATTSNIATLQSQAMVVQSSSVSDIASITSNGIYHVDGGSVSNAPSDFSSGDAGIVERASTANHPPYYRLTDQSGNTWDGVQGASFGSGKKSYVSGFSIPVEIFSIFPGSLNWTRHANSADVSLATSSLASSASSAIQSNSQAINGLSATSNQNSLLTSEALASLQSSALPVVYGETHGNLGNVTSNGIYTIANPSDVTGLPSDYPTGNSGTNAIMQVYAPGGQFPHYELDDFNGNQWLGVASIAFVQSGSSFVQQSAVDWTRQLNASDVNSLGSAANGANSATGSLANSVSANSSAISSVANSASSAVTSLSSATSSGLSSLAANASNAVLYNGSTAALQGMQSDGIWLVSSNNNQTGSAAVAFTKKLGSNWWSPEIAAMIDNYGNFYTGYTTVPYEAPVMSQMASQLYVSTVASSVASSVGGSASSYISSVASSANSAMFKYQSVYVGNFHSIWDGYSDGYYQVNSSNVQDLPSNFNGTGILHRVSDGAGHFNFTLFDDNGNQWFQTYDSNSFTWSNWQQTATQSYASSVANSVGNSASSYASSAAQSAVQSMSNFVNSPTAFGALMQNAFDNNSSLFKDNNSQMQALAQSNGFDYPSITQGNCHFTIGDWEFNNIPGGVTGLPMNVSFYADFFNIVMLNMSVQLILTNVGDMFYRVAGKSWTVLIRTSY